VFDFFQKQPKRPFSYRVAGLLLVVESGFKMPYLERVVKDFEVKFYEFSMGCTNVAMFSHISFVCVVFIEKK